MCMIYPTGYEPLYFLKLHAGRWSAPLSLALILGYMGLTFFLYRKGASLPAPWPDRLRRLNRVLALILYAFILYVLHLGSHLEELSGQSVCLGALLSLAPLLIMLGMESFSDLFWRHRIAGIGRLLGDIRLRIRFLFAFFFLPFVGVMIVVDVVNMLPGVSELTTLFPFTMWIIGGGLVTGVILALPILLIWILRARPIEDPGLLDLLGALCKRAGCYCYRFCAVPTQPAGVLNAFITGLGRAKAVFFTDELLRLGVTSTATVFGHELGHAKRHHIIWMATFMLSYIICTAFLIEEGFMTPPGLLPLVLLCVGALGFISRRFELEADLIGAELCGDPWLFCQTLERACLAGGYRRERRSLRHLSVADRVSFIHKAFGSEAARGRFLQRLKGIKVVISLLAVAAFACTLHILIKQIEDIPDRHRYLIACKLVQQAEQSLNEGDHRRAERILKTAIKYNAELPVKAYILLGHAQKELGKLRQAYQNYSLAFRLRPTDPMQRIHLEEALNTLAGD